MAPAGIYVLLAMALDRPELTHGWAIPCATDIAFSYMAARLIFPANHPAIRAFGAAPRLSEFDTDAYR